MLRYGNFDFNTALAKGLVCCPMVPCEDGACVDLLVHCMVPMQTVWGSAHYSLDEPLHITQVRAAVTQRRLTGAAVGLVGVWLQMCVPKF